MRGRTAALACRSVVTAGVVASVATAAGPLRLRLRAWAEPRFSRWPPACTPRRRSPSAPAPCSRAMVAQRPQRFRTAASSRSRAGRLRGCAQVTPVRGRACLEGRRAVHPQAVEPLAGKSVKWQLLKWSGWNGTTFTKRQVLYTAPKKFQGFNGIAFGPNGRLYVGVDVGLLNGNDHGPANTSPFVYDILSFKPNGKDRKVFASGIRQPWQMAFPKGSSSPFVSDLGQDKGAKNPPDLGLFREKIKISGLQPARGQQLHGASPSRSSSSSPTPTSWASRSSATGCT